MPVPVHTSPKLPAHPVHKFQSGLTLAPLNKVSIPGNQPLSAPGCGDYPSRPRRIWEEDENSPATIKQGFHKGLAFADTASAIKGSLTKVGKPPLPTLFPTLQSNHLAFLPTQNTGSMSLYEKGAFSPVYEEESPEVPSSPIEPVTPFGPFEDKATSHGPTIVDPSMHSVPDWSQDPVVQAPQLCEPEPMPEDYGSIKADVSSSHVVTPSATPEYRRLAEYFSEWISKFVWKVCTTGMALPESYVRSGSSRTVYSDVPHYLPGSVYSLLLSTLLEPSAILLALWYIARLPVYFAALPLPLDKEREAQFRTHLLGGEVTGSEREAMESEAPFRLIVLGFMLSNKWLSDHTYSNKTWHNISSVPISYLNTLESMALGIFHYDLSISDENWSKWLTFVLSYHTVVASPGYLQPISRPSSTPHGLIRKSIEDVIVAVNSRSGDGSPEPVFTGLEERRREQREKAMATSDAYEIDLDEDGPLREEYLPRRRGSETRSSGHDVAMQSGRALPPPAKWSPAGDEPVLRDSQRVNGHFASAAIYPVYPAYHTYEQNQELCSNQNWPIGGYITPMKQIPIPAYGLDATHIHPQGYNHISFQSLAMSHSRSQSLSYGQDNITASRNHLRSSSQSRCVAYTPNGMDVTHQEHLWGVAPQVFPSVFNVAYHHTSWLCN